MGGIVDHRTTARAAKKSAIALVKTDGVDSERVPPLSPGLPLVLLLPSVELFPPGVDLNSSGSGTPLWKARMISEACSAKE